MLSLRLQPIRSNCSTYRSRYFAAKKTWIHPRPTMTIHCRVTRSRSWMPRALAPPATVTQAPWPSSKAAPRAASQHPHPNKMISTRILARSSSSSPGSTISTTRTMRGRRAPPELQLRSFGSRESSVSATLNRLLQE